MKIDIRLWLGTVLLTLLSLLAAFFVTFNMVFSDVFGALERLESYLFAGTVFFALGLGAGLIGSARVRRWTWILGAPSVAILALYTFTEYQNVLIHLGFAVLVPLASYGGARLGSRLRGKKPAPPARP
ncbi:MAG TPA: hypothetical protein VL426_03860 [Candidatus Binatia bacterium]|jgi:hypothetical protein|nr:hypothetical protein [Candidatus Binatia bacterium]